MGKEGMFFMIPFLLLGHSFNLCAVSPAIVAEVGRTSYSLRLGVFSCFATGRHPVTSRRCASVTACSCHHLRLSMKIQTSYSIMTLIVGDTLF